jgi:hypothetical protein
MSKEIKRVVLLFLIILFLCPYHPAAQTENISSFSGKVTDAKTGEALPGVNVYIAGSSVGSSTDEAGNYSFRTSLTGNHSIVFSMLGYGFEARAITMSSGGSYVIDAKMEPVTIQLQEVEVISSNKEWRGNFEYFRNQFIGVTEFADETKIANSWVLSFELEKNILSAYANQPLIVINRALGYEIHIELVRFEWDINTNLGIYKVYYHFEDLQAKDKQQHKKWLRNRIETFLGSKNHFFRSLYRGDWRENHYSISDNDNLYSLSNKDLKYYFLTATSPIYKKPEGWQVFKLENLVKIKYYQKLTYEIENEEFTVELDKVSGIKSGTPDKIFLVNKWGFLKDIESVRLYGIWGINRIANSLPNNFTYTP